jgi:myo-inositol-1(or 4)-monophosphatase
MLKLIERRWKTTRSLQNPSFCFMIDITDLRNIGKRLKDEIPSLLQGLYGSESIGKGASGDKTYPIDKRAEEIVFEELERLNKPITVISEEFGVMDIRGGGQRLLLDPIDGSTNATSGISLYSTSMALIDGDRVGDTCTGYVVNLVSGDEFFAIKGKGSFLNDISITTQKDDKMRVILYETQTPGRDIPKILPLLSLFRRARCLGSTALDMAFLSQGSVSMFVTPAPSRSFDFAAGYLLVREAGGVVTDLKGNGIDDIKIGVQRAIPILASANEKLHKKALGIPQK